MTRPHAATVALVGLFLALSGPVIAATIYGPTVFMDDVSLGTWSAIDTADVSIATTTGGTWTNATAYTNYYRICGTNAKGRLPASDVLSITFTGNTNTTNAVAISWERYDGIRSYVIEYSADNASWTNWLTATANTTNWTDTGTNSWTQTMFTNLYSVIASPSTPFGSTQDVASLQAQITANTAYTNPAATAMQDLSDDTSPSLGGTLNATAKRIENLANPDSGDDALNRDYADTRYVAVAGDTTEWDNEAGIGGTTGAKYMEIVIDLNPAGYPGNWTDYEIKIFNVTNTAEEWSNANMVYYYQTMGDPWDNASAYGDTNARAYFVDDHDAWPAETRGILKWSLYTNETAGVDVLSISGQLVSEDSVLDSVTHCPSHEGCQVDWTTWQWYTNRHNLRGSFIRYDPIGPETNSLGTGRWQPIKHIYWEPKRMNEAPLPQG